ncbi:hypothetical protein TNIN_486531 [Trichonephila inaurata madagascariensis]|uniref:Uncharacterized protein n=1 Tax=Trichonephila inaurata madagascariensis TaxID=2747483 RepID=A0A8X6Y941_9ARAC|nr:hypothetical protein TNIN_486531 [Trichonephila inaurata madagascariensis]
MDRPSRRLKAALLSSSVPGTSLSPEEMGCLATDGGSVFHRGQHRFMSFSPMVLVLVTGVMSELKAIILSYSVM